MTEAKAEKVDEAAIKAALSADDAPSASDVASEVASASSRLV